MRQALLVVTVLATASAYGQMTPSQAQPTEAPRRGWFSSFRSSNETPVPQQAPLGEPVYMGTQPSQSSTAQQVPEAKQTRPRSSSASRRTEATPASRRTSRSSSSESDSSKSRTSSARESKEDSEKTTKRPAPETKTDEEKKEEAARRKMLRDIDVASTVVLNFMTAANQGEYIKALENLSPAQQKFFETELSIPYGGVKGVLDQITHYGDVENIKWEPEDLRLIGDGIHIEADIIFVDGKVERRGLDLLRIGEDDNWKIVLDMRQFSSPPPPPTSAPAATPFPTPKPAPPPTPKPSPSPTPAPAQPTKAEPAKTPTASVSPTPDSNAQAKASASPSPKPTEKSGKSAFSDFPYKKPD